MKLFKVLTLVTVTVCLAATSAFAIPASDTSDAKASGQRMDGIPGSGIIEHKEKDFKGKDFKGKGFKGKGVRCKDGAAMPKDPVEFLKAKKEQVQQLVKEGKITQEKADAITAKIDVRIKEAEEFNKLTLQQKKDKLTGDFKAFLDKKVKEGKLTREKADELLKKFSEKLKDWDGNGFPPSFGRGFKGGKRQGKDSQK